ncbi:MAG: hypothetical protein ACPKPY_03355 [Nitrososphaeraceae archaeon]
MNANNVKVNNSFINMNFSEIDMTSTYIIYDPMSDTISIHIPFNIASRYLPN